MDMPGLAIQFTLKYCNIDKAAILFGTPGNLLTRVMAILFHSPVKSASDNISNNALGAFSGYAAQYKSLIIPK
jgi:hypothetical protein